MARTSEQAQAPGTFALAWDAILGLRPAFALIAVWLTTAGHTMNFRELNAARGWVSAEGYSLHSLFLFSIALALVAAPRLAARFGSFRLVVSGLFLLASSSLASGILLHASEEILLTARVLAGCGSGFVIYSAPRILPPSRADQVAWAGIVLPPAGPIAIAYAADGYGWYSWEAGFVFEGVLALVGLALVLSISDPPDADSGAASPEQAGPSLAYLPAAIVGALAVWHVIHWGQLYGWLEGPTIVAALIAASASFVVVTWMAWARLDARALLEGMPRLGMIAYGGFVQYFNTSDMGLYGGLLLNLNPLRRSWLVVSLSIGSAIALGVGRIVWRRRSPGYAGACFGLIVLACGMALSHRNTLNWPFWRELNTQEFNWFAAPQHWQFVPARLLMGFGSGMVLLSMMSRASVDRAREEKIRPYLQVAQFVGGGLSVGALVTVLLAVHQLEYSYVADRGFIQSDEQSARRTILAEYLATSGNRSPGAAADSLLYRAVNYTADNQLFADIYGGFFVASLALAIPCGLKSVIDFAGARRAGEKG
jgi:MFS family permease